MKVQEISAKQKLVVLHWSIKRKVVITKKKKKYCLSKGKISYFKYSRAFVLFYTAALRRAVCSLSPPLF